jgi:hypothetical protein
LGRRPDPVCLAACLVGCTYIAASCADSCLELFGRWNRPATLACLGVCSAILLYCNNECRRACGYSSWP